MTPSGLKIWFLLLSAPTVHACSCSFPTVADALRNSPIVFAGQLTSITYFDPIRYFEGSGKIGRRPRRLAATFRVSTMFKGSGDKTVVVHAIDAPGGCASFSGMIGSEWVIFAARQTVRLGSEWKGVLREGHIFTTIAPCSLSAQGEQAVKVGDALRALTRQ